MESVVKDLKEKANRLRLNLLEIAIRSKRAHLGGTYSAIEIFIALFYSGIFDFYKLGNSIKLGDQFLIGKGHACLALYLIWNDLGLLTDDQLSTYGKDGGLGGQLDMSLETCRNITGSLGHALGIASGISLAAKIDNKASKTVVLLGDAECEEGSIWEAVTFASRNKLDNLICIVDRNRLSVTKVMDYDDTSGPIENQFASFGWNVMVIDGHNLNELLHAFQSLRVNNSGRPSVIVANTIKGKGVSFMENATKWHHAIPGDDELRIAREELGVVNG